MRGSSEPVRIDMVDPCFHASVSVQYTDEELARFSDLGRCADCNFNKKNRWLCLESDCKRVMCGDSHFDHSTDHFKRNKSHPVHQNLSTQRLWCYVCQRETVFPNPVLEEKENSDSMDGYDEIGVPKGLQNIGNTCYMNAALQALCNIPPFREHFTQPYFPAIADDRKHCLSRNFQKLIQDMCERGGSAYLVPSGILHGIRSVHPMFRGYQQHDTQEFLRCFMDQLHDELKEQIIDVPHPRLVSSKMAVCMMGNMEEEGEEEEDGRGDQAEGGVSSGSQSEAEYETCDSGVDERSSLSDEGERSSIKRKQSLSSSPPARCKMASRPLSFRGPASPGKQKRRPIKHRSIISDLFDGKLLSSVECLTCNKVSTRVETFQDLSLPIPSRDHVTMLHQGSLSPQAMATCSDVYKGRPTWVSWLWEWVKSWFWGPTVSLHDCLAAFFSADELKGDNMYSCEKCSKLRNGVKFSKVLDLPEVLCVHLKRFRHELAFSSKIANFVSFPLTDLDMGLYLHKDCRSEVKSYDLTSVICHHGTAGGGHYTCYAINHLTGQWYELDDQCVTPVSDETVANVEGYVLFYKKNNKKVQQIWKKTLELMSSRGADQTLMEFYVSQRWMSRLKTFAEPGPIDNSDFLCPHGAVHPSKIPFVTNMTVVVSAEVWEFLHTEFKGGPACNQLYQCLTCEEEQLLLQNRMNYELSQYLALRQESKMDENPFIIYGVSMNWFRLWEAFVQGIAEPPGPIDNSSIVTTVNGQRILKIGSDYGQFSHEMWYFFWNIYGGGPELVIKQLTRGPSRASFSSGISVEREREKVSVSASKAKSVESLPVNLGAGDMLMPRDTRSSRTHSVSSDNVNIKKAAATASHRKQQSLDNVRLEKMTRLEHENPNESQRPEESCESEENAYCPAFTPDELDAYVPFKKNTKQSSVSGL